MGADWRESNAHQWMYSLDEVLYPDVIGLVNFLDLNGIDPAVLHPWYAWPAYGATQKGACARLQIEATDRLHVILGGRYGSYD